ncbi:TAF13 [Ecytonucleospora hepatopenaei]|uniref:Transcription initiation factor TFIID subunit 13 n=1 Tax=Ecytonucleospora hepatopenaei TaxID=646526 RepID=A0A1W0E6B9_9MICR|nr:TAF13 [Ecytonucleospora hepatopenaei]
MREQKRNTFLKEVRMMLYAFGDVETPRIDTTSVVHNYLCEYLSTLLIKTHKMAQIKGKTKTEDLLFFLKRDRTKYTRVKNLLLTNEELINARKIFEAKDYEKDEK